jgi:hypothetical protein
MAVVATVRRLIEDPPLRSDGSIVDESLLDDCASALEAAYGVMNGVAGAMEADVLLGDEESRT